MVVEFHDQKGAMPCHSRFQEWRRCHPDGFFLTFASAHQVRLHATLCLHTGGVDWTFEDSGHSLTKKRKVCEETEEALLAWAENAGVFVSRCADCLRGQPTPGGESIPMTNRRDQPPTKSAPGRRQRQVAAGGSAGDDDLAQVEMVFLCVASHPVQRTQAVFHRGRRQ